MEDSSPTATVGSFAPPTPIVFGSTFDSNSTHHFGSKLSIKLQENMDRTRSGRVHLTPLNNL